MASESKRRGKKRGQNHHRKAGNKSMNKGSTERWILKKLRK